MDNSVNPILIDYSIEDKQSFLRHLFQTYFASDGFHELSPFIRERNARMAVDLLDEVR